MGNPTRAASPQAAIEACLIFSLQQNHHTTYLDHHNQQAFRIVIFYLNNKANFLLLPVVWLLVCKLRVVRLGEENNILWDLADHYNAPKSNAELESIYFFLKKSWQSHRKDLSSLCHGEAGRGAWVGAGGAGRGAPGRPGAPSLSIILTSVPGFCHPYGTVAIQMDDV